MTPSPENFDWLTFLSNWHEKEYERRYTLENIVVTPISLLTGAFAIMYVLLTQYDFQHARTLCTVLFVLPLAAALVLALWSSVYVYKSYALLKYGPYKGIPDATALRKHMDELVEFYRQHEPEKDGVQQFKAYFVDVLAQQITTNVLNNDERTRDIQKAKDPLMAALLALLLSLPCFLVNQWDKPETVHQVSITSHLPATMSNNNPRPTPPPPPPQREIREHTPRPTSPPRPQVGEK